MLYPSINEIKKKADSRYTLCILAAQRARDLIDGKPALLEEDSGRPVSIAAHEINEDLITYRHVDPETEAAEKAAAEKARRERAAREVAADDARSSVSAEEDAEENTDEETVESPEAGGEADAPAESPDEEPEEGEAD